MVWIPLTIWWMTEVCQSIGSFGDQNSWFWKTMSCLKLRVTRLPWKPLHFQPYPVTDWWNHLITGGFCLWLPHGDLPSPTGVYAVGSSQYEGLATVWILAINFTCKMLWIKAWLGPGCLIVLGIICITWSCMARHIGNAGELWSGFIARI